MNRRSSRVLVACGAALALAAFTSVHAPGALAQTPAPAAAPAAPTGAGVLAPAPTIAASASATESREPDQAEITLGVAAVGRTSAEAMDALNRQMDAVIRAVKGTNLPGLTTQTQQVSLYPQYEQPRPVPMGAEPPPQQEPKIVGYMASNSVRVVVGDVRRAGAVVDAGVGAGANQIMGVRFTLRNDAEARVVAIRRAAAEARVKAQAIAEALGVRLGRVMSASTGNVQVRPVYEKLMRGVAADAAVAPTPLEGGQVEVGADVTVEFEIIGQ
jgi:uncharacterized protein YggE